MAKENFSHVIIANKTKFRNKFLKIKENKPHLFCKKGLYEKDMIIWYSYEDIKKKFDTFRPFYKNIVKTILRIF